MRIVILGGKGFIGSYLTNELAAHGHQVTVTTRDQKSAVDGSGAVYWDGVDRTTLARILDGSGAVVNLVGENIGAKPWSKARKAQLISSRVNTATVLVETIKTLKNKPEALVQASAVGYYGTGEQSMDESAPNGIDWLAQLARDWETPAKSLNETETRVVIIRSGVVLAKAGSVLQKLALPFKFFIGGPLGSGRQWFSWIHIQDEVRAIRYLIENKKCSGVYNLTAPDTLRNSEVGRILAAALRRPYWLPVPAFALKLLLGEMSTILLDGQKVLPKRLTEAGYDFAFKTAKTAVMDLL
jgi:uncharacterized protein